MYFNANCKLVSFELIYFLLLNTAAQFLFQLKIRTLPSSSQQLQAIIPMQRALNSILLK